MHAWSGIVGADVRRILAALRMFLLLTTACVWRDCLLLHRSLEQVIVGVCACPSYRVELTCHLTCMAFESPPVHS